MLPIPALPRREAVAVLGIMLLAAALRFYRLDALPLWQDEAASLVHASRPFFSIWGVDIHPPLYYLLLHLWLVFGDSAFALRSLSALIGIATVPLVFAAGRVIGGARLGLIATLLLAIAPYHLRYTQEARMYALMTFGAALALWGLAWLLKNRDAAMVDLRALVPLKRYRDLPRPPLDAILAWTAYAVGALIVIYSQNTGVFFLAAANRPRPPGSCSGPGWPARSSTWCASTGSSRPIGRRSPPRSTSSISRTATARWSRCPRSCCWTSSASGSGRGGGRRSGSS